MYTTAACYDSRNHCVWTCNDDWIDVWDCAGKVHVAAHLIASRLGKASIAELIPPSLTPHQPHPYSSNAISVSEAISLMLRHVGIESCRLVPGCEFSTTVVHNLPLSFLEQCCDLLKCNLKDGSWDNALAVVVTLLAVLPAFLSNKKFSNDKLIPLKERVRYANMCVNQVISLSQNLTCICLENIVCVAHSVIILKVKLHIISIKYEVV